MYRLLNNKREMMDGDETSIMVVFNNIIGKNIYGVQYYMYLDFVKREAGLERGSVEIVYEAGNNKS